ncbi:MAG: hypothetical protein RLZZ175_1107 [Bacteroidota bacterium]|jgi:hypothetical protein
MLKLSSKYIYILFVFISLKTYGQDLKICDVKHIEGDFAFEWSNDLWSEDDMIYRRASLFVIQNDSIAYKEGFYAFEYGLEVPKQCINEQNSKSIKYFSIGINDSLHSVLEKYETSILSTKEGQYKCFNLSLNVMYLGDGVIRIRRGNEFIKRKVPLYLVLNFNKIRGQDR